jgi:hypothetical protein
MKKVSELEGPELDYWVATVEGMEPRIGANGECYTFDGKYSPSSNWSQGGRIIERELGSIIPYEDEKSAEGIWKAGNICKCQLKGMGFVGEGKTILEAAMRAYVGDKFGDEVDDRETHHI